MYQINQQQQQPYTALLKMVFIGDSSVGKTSLLHHEVNGQFNLNYNCNIGVDFKIKMYYLNGFNVKAQLWDTAGAERFKSISKAYYRGAQAVNICFDLNNIKSFESVSNWLCQTKQHAFNNCQIFLVGCKSDLKHQVSKEQIQKFSSQNGVPYFLDFSKRRYRSKIIFLNYNDNCDPKKIVRNGQLILQINCPQAGIEKIYLFGLLILHQCNLIFIFQIVQKSKIRCYSCSCYSKKIQQNADYQSSNQFCLNNLKNGLFAKFIDFCKHMQLKSLIFRLQTFSKFIF